MCLIGKYATKSPHRPVNGSAIRVTGRELKPLIERLEINNRALEELYQRIVAELEHAAPRTQDGKQVEHIVLHFSRVLSRLSQVSTLRAMAMSMEDFGTEQPADEAICPVGPATIIGGVPA